MRSRHISSVGGVSTNVAIECRTYPAKIAPTRSASPASAGRSESEVAVLGEERSAATGRFWTFAPRPVPFPVEAAYSTRTSVNSHSPASLCPVRS